MKRSHYQSLPFCICIAAFLFEGCGDEAEGDADTLGTGSTSNTSGPPTTSSGTTPEGVQPGPDPSLPDTPGTLLPGDPSGSPSNTESPANPSLNPPGGGGTPNPDPNTPTGGGGGAPPASGGNGGAPDGPTGDGGGSSGTPGDGGAPDGPVTTGDCNFTVDSETSSAIPTVGIVTWSTDLADVTSATIDFGLEGGDANLQAPVDLEDKSGNDYRTLLLGMKQQRTYEFRITASSASTNCTSETYSVTTGSLSGAPQIDQEVMNAAAGIGGFIVTSPGIGGFGGGGGGGGSAATYIIDADGDVVWATSGPSTTSRAHLSYDGKQMWMLSLNVQNSGGEMAWVSMDGMDVHRNIEGLSTAHHDFCVRPDNGITALLWDGSGGDPPSNLVEWSQDGSMRTVVRIDSNIYQSNTYHTNAIHYTPWDGGYTIGDRNPNLFVKLTGEGELEWQLGGNCNGAPAPVCVSGNWQVNHGHDLLENGRFVFFNNGSGGDATIYEYEITGSGNMVMANEVTSFSHGSSMVLGDVQALPNGGFLVAYSTDGTIDEIDAQGNQVRRLTTSSVGYADWRATLYGPPPRL